MNQHSMILIFQEMGRTRRPSVFFCGATDNPLSFGPMFYRLSVMDISDSPPVRHLLTSRWSARQTSFHPCACTQTFVENVSHQLVRDTKG